MGKVKVVKVRDGEKKEPSVTGDKLMEETHSLDLTPVRKKRLLHNY